MRLRYTLPALSDLESILNYIATTSPQGAERVQRRIRNLIALLLEHPGIGTPTDDPAIRRLTTSPYPFLVFYEIAGDEIVIHGIRHGAREPNGMPGAR